MPYQFNPLTGNFDLVNPQLTGAEIKTLYEGEDNTNAFTDAEKSKLTGLDSANYATASQGIKADNSVQLTGSQTVAGTKTFTSPLILPNNSRVNGVEHFYQSTKPVTRGDGSALVSGDVCYEIGKRHWFFNGTYWLSEPFTVGFGILASDMVERIGEDERGLFLNYVVAKGRVASAPNWNASNYWQTNLFFGGLNLANFALLNSTSGYVGGADNHFYRKFEMNTAIIPTYPSVSGSNIIYAQVRSVGSPTGAGSGSASLSYFYNLSFIWL